MSFLSVGLIGLKNPQFFPEQRRTSAGCKDQREIDLGAKRSECTMVVSD